MKMPILAVCGAALLLAGCATLSDSDRAALQRSRVPLELQERMDRRGSLELAEIIELSRRKVDSSLIIRYLRSTGRVYTLTSHEVVKLRDAGVRPAVIDYLLATPSLFATRYVDPYPWWGIEPYDYYYRPYYYRPYVVVRGHPGHRGKHRR